MEDPKSCPICTRELYSINSKRLGETLICSNCNDVFSPIVNGFAFELVELAIKLTAQYGNQRDTALGFAQGFFKEGILTTETYERVKFEINIA